MSEQERAGRKGGDAGKTLVKYVFIQDDPFYLPGVLEGYLGEFHDSTAGVNVQSVAQGGRSLPGTALALYKIYGPRYFLWKSSRMAAQRVKAKLINDLFGSTRRCYSVGAVAGKYGVPVHETPNVNSDEFRALLKELGVELIVSISGTQFYGRKLREQIPRGIINCHGALLPKYRGLMPSFWTLANGEQEGGISVHFVDDKIDNGPILVQRRFGIDPGDTLEQIMARGKALAPGAIIEAVRMVESGSFETIANPEEEATSFSMPGPEDVRRFLAQGHRFF
jgi:methionyl-tRNA formyltransferase